jgi:microcystin-dependent protein
VGSPYLSEIRIMSFNFAPRGWAQCNGQLLPINQNQALFSLLGTAYGGDGRSNFGLPNLQGRVPIHMGGGFSLAQQAGEIAHTLNIQEMASHNHLMAATASTATEQIPTSNLYLAQAQSQATNKPDVYIYGTGGTGPQLASATIGQNGGGGAHPNQQPYLVLNICIALQGVFPSRS